MIPGAVVEEITMSVDAIAASKRLEWKRFNLERSGEFVGLFFRAVHDRYLANSSWL